MRHWEHKIVLTPPRKFTTDECVSCFSFDRVYVLVRVRVRLGLDTGAHTRLRSFGMKL